MIWAVLVALGVSALVVAAAAQGDETRDYGSLEGLAVLGAVPRRPKRTLAGSVMTGASSPKAEPGAEPGAEPCDLPVGPAKFTTSAQTGELRESLDRIGAGTKPYAVAITGTRIQRIGGSQRTIESRSAVRDAVLAARDVGDLESWPFRPPASTGATVDGGGNGVTWWGYVVSRYRRSWGPVEALVAAQKYSGLRPVGATIAAARLAAAGDVTMRWDVAIWVPSRCAYVVVPVEADPLADAFANRL